MNFNLLSRRPSSSRMPRLLGWGLVALVAGSAQATVHTWTGDAAASGNTVGDWYTTSPGNWSGDIAPTYSNTADIKVAGTQDLDQYIRQHITIRSLEFTSSNIGPTQIGFEAANGNDRDLTFSADLGASTLTIDALASGDKTLGTKGGAVTSGEVVLSSDLDITHNGSGSLIFACEIRGAGNITLAGTGTTEFNGVGIYEGDTTIEGASILVGGTNQAFGTQGTVTLAASDATLKLADGVTISNTLTVSNTGDAKTLRLASDATSGTWAGEIVIAETNATHFVVEAANAQTLTLSGVISGTSAAGITKTGTGSLILSSTNAYTGNTTVDDGLLTLSDGAQLAFTIGTNGVNNALSGSGNIMLDGDFLLDLTGAGRTLGDSWQLVEVDTLTETFGPNFSLASTAGSFAETNGVWSITENGVDFEFAESTGQLTVVSAMPVAHWKSGAYGVGWIFRAQDAAEIAAWDIDTLVTQVQTIPNVTYVNFNLSDAAGGSQFLAPHSVLSALDTQLDDPVFIPNERDLFAEALTKFKAAGYKVDVYYASQGPALLKHGVDKAEDKVPDGNGGYTSASMDVWSNYVHSVYGNTTRETYKTAHAEIIFAEYAERYGKLVDAWWFDNGIDNYNAPLQYAIAKKYNPNVVVHSSTAPSTENDALNGHPVPLQQHPASSDVNLPQLTNIEISDGGYRYTGDHPSLGQMYMAMGTAWYAGDIVWSVDKAADWIERTLNAGGTWCWSFDCTDSLSILRADMVTFALDVQNKIDENKSNFAPVFAADPIIGGNATQDVAYAGSIFGSATDGDGDPLSYIKLAGPEWLSIATNGVLSGMPANSNVGLNSFLVGAVDGKGHNTIATLEITVDPPVTLLQFDNLRGRIGTTPTINGANITDPNVSITKATQGNDVVYAMSIINQDLDGGGTFTDSLSWDIRVKGYTGGSAVTNGNDSSVTLGSSTFVGTTDNEFGVSGTDTRFINAGESILFSVENIVLRADAGLSAQFDGFSGLWGTAGSYIYGVGAGGLESQVSEANGELTFATNLILTVTSVENIERIRDLDGSFTVSAAEPPVPEMGFAAWIAGFGLSGDDLLPETDVEPDGLNNLLEYALGGNPTNPNDIGYVPTSGILEDGGTNWFEVVHARRIGSETELDYELEFSSNLLSNDWKSSSYIELPITGTLDADYEAVTNRIDTAGKTNEFIRLKIEVL